MKIASFSVVFAALLCAQPAGAAAAVDAKTEKKVKALHAEVAKLALAAAKKHQASLKEAKKAADDESASRAEYAKAFAKWREADQLEHDAKKSAANADRAEAREELLRANTVALRCYRAGIDMRNAAARAERLGKDIETFKSVTKPEDTWAAAVLQRWSAALETVKTKEVPEANARYDRLVKETNDIRNAAYKLVSAAHELDPQDDKSSLKEFFTDATELSCTTGKFEPVMKH
jgi:hypothetical protein